MTLGVAAAAGVRLIVWCKECQHQVEPDPIEMANRYGAGTSVLDWRERLVCSRCGGRQVDMVVTGTQRCSLKSVFAEIAEKGDGTETMNGQILTC